MSENIKNLPKDWQKVWVIEKNIDGEYYITSHIWDPDEELEPNPKIWFSTKKEAKEALKNNMSENYWYKIQTHPLMVAHNRLLQEDFDDVQLSKWTLKYFDLVCEIDTILNS